MASPAPYQLFVGADIAARSFTATWGRADAPLTRPVRYDQTPDGFAAFQATLAASGVAPTATLIIMEATSTYWIQLATALHTAGYAVSVVNPKQAHDFAKAVLQHAKTDPLDAKMLAHLGMKLTPPQWTPPLSLLRTGQDPSAASADRHSAQSPAYGELAFGHSSRSNPSFYLRALHGTSSLTTATK